MKSLALFLCSLFCVMNTGLSAVDSGEMDGIAFKKYIGFENKWKLVTVRYRKDTAELRITYANKLAYKTLLSGKNDYPDGAVFGKIGMATEEDPSFTSSAVPSGARRYQLMVKNSKKYKENNGWGYALFDERGHVFPEELKKQVEACVACHNAVADKGHIFSQIMNIHSRVKSPPSSNWATLHMAKKMTFEMVPVSALPEKINALIPKNFKYARMLTGEMSDKVFQGTLEEIRPTLSLESFESKLPSILLSKDKKRFSVVIPESSSASCLSEGKKGIFLKSVYSNLNDEGNYELHFCYTH